MVSITPPIPSCDTLDDKGGGCSRNILPATTLITTTECLALRNEEPQQQRKGAEKQLLRRVCSELSIGILQLCKKLLRNRERRTACILVLFLFSDKISIAAFALATAASSATF